MLSVSRLQGAVIGLSAAAALLGCRTRLNELAPHDGSTWPSADAHAMDDGSIDIGVISDGALDIGSMTDAMVDAGVDAGRCQAPSGPPLVFRSAAYCLGGSAPRDVKAADLNADGKLDLVVANLSSDSVSVFLGFGDGTFAAAKDFPVADAPISIAIADFNVDGRADLVVGHESSTDDKIVSVLLGNGDGTFGKEGRISAGGWPRAVATGDFDRDGKTDLVVGDGLDNDVSVLFGNGDGTFKSVMRHAAGDSPDGVVVLDWNGDGALDIGVSDQNLGMEVLMGDGAGAFTPTNIDANLNGGQIVAGDLDCDGRPELIAGDMHTMMGGVMIARHGVPSTTLSSMNPGPSAVTVADLDGDGKLDVVAASAYSGGNGLAVFVGNGDGTLKAAQSLTDKLYRNMDPIGVAAGDFDGDGRPDLAVAAGVGLIAILMNQTGASAGADAGVGSPSGGAGACSPPQPGGIHPITPLATEQNDPVGVAVDGTHVYFTDFAYPDFTAGTVMQVAKVGGTPVELASGQGSPGDIATDGSHVYWGNYNGNAIMRVAIGGGTPELISEAGGSPVGVQVDSSRVYWANPAGVGGGSFSATGLVAAPVAGGSHEVLYGNGGTWAVAMDNENLYLAAGDILMVPKSGAPVVVLVPAQGAYFGLAVDAKNVYFTTWDSASNLSTLWAKSLTGSDTPRILATGISGLGPVLSDGTNVYWLDGSFIASVMRVPTAGGAPTAIAWGQITPMRIALDADSVYWTARAAGQVLKMAK